VLPDVEAEIALVVLVALMVLTFLEMERELVVQREVAQHVDLSKVVVIASVVVVPLIVVFYMVKANAYCDLPHCVCHEGCVLDDLMETIERIVLVVLYTLEQPPLRS
jgi:hypothetical protein